MKTVKVLLMGGVGNRLFQIARALSMKDNQNKSEVIAIPPAIEKMARLFGWSNHQQWIDLKDLCKGIDIVHRQATITEIIYILVVYLLRKAKIYDFPFDEPLDKKISRKLELGYFQTKHHVNKKAVFFIANQLRRHIKIQPTQRTVVHIRGGDFTAETRTSSSDLNRVEEKSAEILYVTNDLKHANAILKHKKDAVIQQSTSDLCDFITLCTAKKLHPTNSTFSFWAAAVVKESGGDVIIPNENSMWQLLRD